MTFLTKLLLISSIGFLTETEAKKYTTLIDGPEFEVNYDSNKKKYKFAVTLPKGKDLWIAFREDAFENQTDIA